MRLALVLACAAAPAAAQYWTGPLQLTTDPADDINPAVCREWLFLGDLTCMVWQTNRNGNWDVYSRFCHFYQGNGWQAEMPVCRDSLHNDMDPAVCAQNDWTDHPSYWCVWERRESPVTGRVMAAFTTFRDQWWPPVELGRTLHDNPADSSQPQVVTIRGSSIDTVWVAWRNRDTFGSYISYTYYDGDTWQPPQTAFGFPGDVRSVRLGRGLTAARLPVPLLVWERNGNVYCSQYVSGAWTRVQEVAPHAAQDRCPEVVSYSYGWFGPPSIIWESERDGDTAVFATPPDSLMVARRACDTAAAGRNWDPCGVQAAFTTDYPPFEGFAAWASDRGGNPDVYSSGHWPYEDQYVDQNPATDVNPCLTAMGVTMVWCCWQSDRSGNWDLYGSYIYGTGVEEAMSDERGAARHVPGIARGVLFSGAGAVPEWSLSRAVLLDASGRAV
ncbi:hypothetical protein FJY71_08980, partial [candidate division WOR-3 bacterium]|nr:hypothetical protein [candidate division WOR-3 bacterium]